MPKQLHQPITDEVLDQVRKTIREARYAALGVIDVRTQHPSVSRVALASLSNATPILLTSALAGHTASLQADGRCSLLIGEIGKGDPMAHPRITLMCHGLKTRANQHEELRDRFLTHHPKARNYIDLPDFGFWQLDIISAGYNAGFGKAYLIDGADLVPVSYVKP